MNFYEEKLKMLEYDFENYTKIENQKTRDQFNVMTNFAAQVARNNVLKAELLIALQKPKPFRSFKNIIEDSVSYREKWFEFRDAQVSMWKR